MYHTIFFTVCITVPRSVSFIVACEINLCTISTNLEIGIFLSWVDLSFLPEFQLWKINQRRDGDRPDRENYSGDNHRANGNLGLVKHRDYLNAANPKELQYCHD